LIHSSTAAATEIAQQISETQIWNSIYIGHTAQQLQPSCHHFQGQREMGNAIVSFYNNLFSEPLEKRPIPANIDFKAISFTAAVNLEQEVWSAINSFAGDKAPGPQLL
ncbi:unnamed protein product, partial [Linum tenue]